jgi:basic membrane lipoprotein Med (substrate-binding protein (PBP1-ABC) superfamily)
MLPHTFVQPIRAFRAWFRAAIPWSALAIFAVAVGCGEVASDRASSQGVDSTRVALLTAGPVSDQGWYAGAFEGLMMLHDSLGMQVSHQQTRTPAEFDEAFLSYAGSGFDLIFAHGFEYQDAAIRAGERFPDVTIVVSGGGRVADNVVPLIFTLEDASYLAGMLAGGTTRTDTIGMVGGVAIPPVQGTFRAFEAGARAVNPGVTVLEAFIGNWDDVAAAKEAAVAQLGRGADVLIHNTDAASFGVFQAVRESVADGRRAWALGMNRDQHAVASDVILGSAVIRIPEAFLEVARRWLAGELGGAPVYEGLTSDVVDLVVNPALEQVIDPTLLDRIDVARTAIRDGTLDVPRVPFVEGEAGVGMESGEPEG